METAETVRVVGRVKWFDPAKGYDGKGHVGIRDGVIVHAGRNKPAAKFDQVLAAKGLWLMPGIVDLAARLREPGASHKATFCSEFAAALAAGITTVVLPPDTQPVVDTPAVVDRIRGTAAQAGSLRVCVLGALTQGLNGEALASMSALKKAGCVGISNAMAPVRDALVARRALEYAHGLGLTVHVFAQDPALANGGCAHEGPVATRLGLPPIPVAAEVAAIRLWISSTSSSTSVWTSCRTTRRSLSIAVNSASIRSPSLLAASRSPSSAFTLSIARESIVRPLNPISFGVARM